MSFMSFNKVSTFRIATSFHVKQNQYPKIQGIINSRCSFFHLSISNTSSQVSLRTFQSCRTDNGIMSQSSLLKNNHSIHHPFLNTFSTMKATSELDSSKSKENKNLPTKIDNEIEKIVDSITNKDVDTRAQAKMNTLSETKQIANVAKDAYYKSLMQHEDETEISKKKEVEGVKNSVFNSWVEKENELADAYSKAIKYTARVRSKDAALNARNLLDEMISRHGIADSRLFYYSRHNGDLVINDEAVTKMISKAEVTTHDDRRNIITSIPPPTKRDFHNVLHSWGSSKARKKGIHAETLLWRMIELYTLYPDKFEFPDSRSFALVIKCYAGSTYKQSMERIRKIHDIHDQLISSNCPELLKDDPFLLMHSIKSISDFKTDAVLAEKWFDRLHSYVTDRNNALDCVITEDNAPKNQVDLTGTYMTMLRGLSRLGAVKSHSILEKMHELNDFNAAARVDGLNHCATIEIKTNAYNSVLGYCHKQQDVSLAIDLLQKMIKYAIACDVESAVPLPNDQTFENVITSLALMNDTNASKVHAERFVQVYEQFVKDQIVQPSTKVHNAYIAFLANQFGDSDDLLRICDNTIDRMNLLANDTPKFKPDVETKANILKACAVDHGNLMVRTEKIERATAIFDELMIDSMIDKCILHMMRCVAHHLLDEEEKKNEMKKLFSLASNNGFVSADVLKELKSNVSAEEFTDLVGDGRLANNWVTNVTSKLALYTDFTNGGAGKNAKRKGKSTSNWMKKQKQRGALIEERKRLKIEKKRLKKKRM
mmetsp:Transcript_5380/g.6892  ORF Transcript_5380/g.6892 Transcript_5380/m.6892 type:complete len:770 (-) Transcript_5380:35-2344(-)